MLSTTTTLKFGIPKGLPYLTHVLAKAIIRAQPENIYEFSATYLETELNARNQHHQMTTKDDGEYAPKERPESGKYGSHGESEKINEFNHDTAATKIQAGFRGYKTRKEMKSALLKRSNDEEIPKKVTPNLYIINEEDEAATKIQAGVRGFLVRKKMKNSMDLGESPSERMDMGQSLDEIQYCVGGDVIHIPQGVDTQNQVNIISQDDMALSETCVQHTTMIPNESITFSSAEECPIRNIQEVIEDLEKELQPEITDVADDASDTAEVKTNETIEDVDNKQDNFIKLTEIIKHHPIVFRELEKIQENHNLDTDSEHNISLANQTSVTHMLESEVAATPTSSGILEEVKQSKIKEIDSEFVKIGADAKAKRHSDTFSGAIKNIEEIQPMEFDIEEEEGSSVIPSAPAVTEKYIAVSDGLAEVEAEIHELQGKATSSEAHIVSVETGTSAPATKTFEGVAASSVDAETSEAQVEFPPIEAESFLVNSETLEAGLAATSVEAETPPTEPETLASEADAPAQEAETPSPEAETPASEAETPSPKAETPAPEAETPASLAETPASLAETPAPEAETPALEAETPAPEAEKPASEAETLAPEAEISASEVAASIIVTPVESKSPMLTQRKRSAEERKTDTVKVETFTVEPETPITELKNPSAEETPPVEAETISAKPVTNFAEVKPETLEIEAGPFALKQEAPALEAEDSEAPLEEKTRVKETTTSVQPQLPETIKTDPIVTDVPVQRRSSKRKTVAGAEKYRSGVVMESFPIIDPTKHMNDVQHLEDLDAEIEAEAEMLNSAASRIQAGYRGYQVRKGLSNAATRIQSNYRGYKTRKELKNQAKAAVKIQATVRGFLTRNKIYKAKSQQLEQRRRISGRRRSSSSLHRHAPNLASTKRYSEG